jgi:hypothetical protein
VDAHHGYGHGGTIAHGKRRHERECSSRYGGILAWNLDQDQTRQVVTKLNCRRVLS